MDFMNSNSSKNLPDYQTAGIKTAGFSPYSDNKGSIIAVAGADFAIIAADTRLSAGNSILTSSQQKLMGLSKTTVWGATGCWCDVLTLGRLLSARLQMYQHDHQKEMTTPAIAQMVSIILYYKRFFPYYAHNIIAGLDTDGKGCVYSYDPIGHMSRTTYTAGGSAGSLLQPFLDNQFGFLNEEVLENLTQDKALEMVKDVFISAAERDIHTGDGVNIKIITKDGIQDTHFDLRKD